MKVALMADLKVEMKAVMRVALWVVPTVETMVVTKVAM